MDGNKLELSGKSPSDPPAATYKPIPETDMEEQAVSRPKSLIKVKSGSEVDGADEKMLPEDETKVANTGVNTADVKISLNEKQNGDAKLDIEDIKTAFVGMGKEELMKYANDPFWVRLRWFLFITFWLLWATMLVGAVLIIVAAPKCDPPPPRTWWQKGPLAEVKPDITAEELKAVDKEIKGIIVPWPEDAYVAFNDSHGTVKLINMAKEQGLKVIVEVEPAVSDIWFEKSELKEADFVNYYIWVDPKGSLENGKPEPPNNWISPNNSSSWTYSEKRKQFYYAPLGKPHLNFWNTNVTKEFSNVIEKLINLGASGIRLRNAQYLLVDPKFENEDISRSQTVSDSSLFDYSFYRHENKTVDLDGLGALLSGWRKVLRNKTEDAPFMVAEEITRISAYKVNGTLVVDLPLQAHVFSRPVLAVSDTVRVLNSTLVHNNIEWPLWKVNTTAVPQDSMDIVTYLLPGVPLVNASEKINGALLKIRENPSIMRGITGIYSIRNNTVLAFIRVTSGNPGILVALNPSDEKVEVSFPNEIPPLSELTEVTVQLYSTNYNETDYMDINAKKSALNVPISPKAALVLSYVPKTAN